MKFTASVFVLAVVASQAMAALMAVPVKGCQKTVVIKSAVTGCDQVTIEYGVSTGQLMAWNSGLQSDCANLAVQAPICVSVAKDHPAYVDDSKPRYDDSKPGYDDSKPGYDDSKPGYDDSKPGYDDGQPGYDGVRKRALANPGQPKYVKPDQPKYVKPDQPKYVTPDQPKYVTPNQPKYVNPGKREHA